MHQNIPTARIVKHANDDYYLSTCLALIKHKYYLFRYLYDYEDGDDHSASSLSYLRSSFIGARVSTVRYYMH